MESDVKGVPGIGAQEVEMEWKDIKNMLKTFVHMAMAVLKAMLIVTIPFACVMGLVLQSLKVVGGMILLGFALWPFLTVMVSGVKLGWGGESAGERKKEFIEGSGGIYEERVEVSGQQMERCQEDCEVDTATP